MKINYVNFILLICLSTSFMINSMESGALNPEYKIIVSALQNPFDKSIQQKIQQSSEKIRIIYNAFSNIFDRLLDLPQDKKELLYNKFLNLSTDKFDALANFLDKASDLKLSDIVSNFKEIHHIESYGDFEAFKENLIKTVLSKLTGVDLAPETRDYVQSAKELAKQKLILFNLTRLSSNENFKKAATAISKIISA